MKTRILTRYVLSVLLAVSVTWGAPALATPEFPGIVEQTLGLTKIEIDPPQGCTLCHTTDSGGTSLRPFGLLLQQDGAQPYQDSTLEAALGAVAQGEPQLIEDIKAGVDPNDDPGISSTPTPSYGCSASRAAPTRSLALSLVAVAVTLVGWRRRRGEVRSARRALHPRRR